MFKRTAFTMIELIFVIVIMGIIGKFGMEFLAQSYRSFVFTTVNNKLQSTSGIAVELIAAKLQHRIKDSVIARVTANPQSAPVAIGSANGNSYTVLEWVGVDYEGFRGNCDLNATPYLPNWSGIIDLNNPNHTNNILVSPETNTTKIDTMIKNLSNNNSTISNAALFFIGANSDVLTDYGWDGNLTKIDANQGAMHPINIGATLDEYTSDVTSDYTGIDVYEYYQLAWTAYAIVYNSGTLTLYWNYQPWEDKDGDGLGDNFNTVGIGVKSATIMENVSSFQFTAIGDILKIQVCTKSTIIDGVNDKQGYSICKEKTVF